MKRLSMIFATALMITGCQTAKDAKNLATLGVDFKFETRHRCNGDSPQFNISKIPSGTGFLDFNMIDISNGNFHGGDTIKYSGSGKIPEGALRVSYRGPCPPVEHRYEMEVQALNAKKDLVLGRGKATRPFCCK